MNPGPNPGAEDAHAKRLQEQLDKFRGWLVVDNKTGMDQILRVHGIDYRIRPGSWKIAIPRAQVEAFLPRYERPKNLGMSWWKGNVMPLVIQYPRTPSPSYRFPLLQRLAGGL